MFEKPQGLLDRVDGRLSGEIDPAVAPAVEADLVAAAICAPGSSFAIDCAELTFIDSSGVHMLHHVAKRSGKHVRLVHLDRGCRRVFEILGSCETFGVAEIET